MVAAAAIIASSALPPSRSTSSADCAASACGATAMPRVPRMEWIMQRFYSTRAGRREKRNRQD